MKLVYLSDKFYNKYKGCKEILEKKSRPYACVTIVIGQHLVAIPIRHHVGHDHSLRTVGDSGLDYTKAVIVSEPGFIASGKPQIETAEFQIIKTQEDRIVREMHRYIKLYMKAKEHANNPHYAKILQYSTLQYFEEYLDGFK